MTSENSNEAPTMPDPSRDIDQQVAPREASMAGMVKNGNGSHRALAILPAPTSTETEEGSEGGGIPSKSSGVTR
eukprot:CAMPEP_0172470070 /NCGR_PEP_ID=MMETSP1065-20121228/65423_1 /TAXON_ID=265537 /ORGANISM="Amphiprora paludosa, Strain CCMP125" /LENGTH=73 /DNA_ID=CAMNT_0013227907 /DNA_START=19 /DNA_END=237 /DNA_ORIENTATION=-